jgi:hypothetical protein
MHIKTRETYQDSKLVEREVREIDPATGTTRCSIFGSDGVLQGEGATTAACTPADEEYAERESLIDRLAALPPDDPTFLVLEASGVDYGTAIPDRRALRSG